MLTEKKGNKGGRRAGSIGEVKTRGQLKGNSFRQGW